MTITIGGNGNGLEPCGRQLEAVQRQGQGTVGQVTDDDLDRIAGNRDQLEGTIQERYGLEKDRARADIDAWCNRQTWT